MVRSDNWKALEDNTKTLEMIKLFVESEVHGV